MSTNWVIILSDYQLFSTLMGCTPKYLSRERLFYLRHIRWSANHWQAKWFTLIMAAAQCFAGNPWVLVFRWLFLDPENTPKHCFRQTLPPLIGTFSSVTFRSGAFWGQMEEAWKSFPGAAPEQFLWCGSTHHPAGGPMSSARVLWQMVFVRWHAHKCQAPGSARWSHVIYFNCQWF